MIPHGCSGSAVNADLRLVLLEATTNQAHAAVLS